MAFSSSREGHSSTRLSFKSGQDYGKWDNLDSSDDEEADPLVAQAAADLARMMME
jgi:hypothetical protein